METNSQLIKKIKEGGYNNVYPIAYIDGIIDKESNEKLSDILIRYNNIMVPWQGDVASTRNRVPSLMRRQGIVITYITDLSEIVTEVYKGTVEDIKNNWADNINWELVPDLKFVQDNASKLPDGIITPEKLSPALQELISQSGSVVNMPDDEDLEQKDMVLKFKDRPYNSELASGKGYKILRKNWTEVGTKTINLLTQDVFNQSNTIYEIRYDFDLNNQIITIPENCILKYEGGSLNNGHIVYQNTKIQGIESLNNITTEGLFTIIDAVTDEEDLHSNNGVLKFADREYNPEDFSGFGRVILRKNIVEVEDPIYGKVKKNILYQDMTNQANTIYVIQYDFTLGEDITVPANCVLEFDGGSLSGAYTITGNNTKIDAQNVTIFNGIVIAGTWICPRITSSWFKDVTNNNRIKQVFNLTNASIQNEVTVEEGNYDVSVSAERESVISINSNTTLFLNGNLILSANGFGNYSIIKISNSYNVHIIGSGHIVGDVETHTGTNGEWGMGIDFDSAKNCYVEGITCEKCWGDGIYIGSDTAEESQSSRIYASKDISLYNVICDSNRRQGLSIVHAENVYVNNSSFSNTGSIKYTTPGYGIDIEPNAGNDWKQSTYNINIICCRFSGNYHSQGISLVSGITSSCANNFITDCALNGELIKNYNTDNLYINNCIGIGNVSIFHGSINGFNDAPKTYINNSSLGYLNYLADSVNYYSIVDINNCKINSTGNAFEKNHWRSHTRIKVRNSELVFNDSIMSNQLFDYTLIENSYIKQNNDTKCLVAGVIINNCTFDVYCLHIRQDQNVELNNNIINHRANTCFYWWDGTKAYLRGNKITNEEGNLIENINSLNYLLIEGKIPASQDNISRFSSKITTLVNRIEHWQ